MKKFKKIWTITLCLSLALILSACAVFMARGQDMRDYQAIFDRNGFALITEGQISSQPVVIDSRDELEVYIQKVINSFDWLNDFPDNKREIINAINAFYAEFDTNFFSTHRLVIAHIDSGSGSLSFNLNRLSLVNNTLVVNIDKNSPMVQTMDYINHILFLSVARGYANFDNVSINLNILHS
ncbi:MAG: hypothetical protein FWE03_05795 [Firmicutes bacterium]|nr:hypothetical protein [Bacillota bacterium]